MFLTYITKNIMKKERCLNRGPIVPIAANIECFTPIFGTARLSKSGLEGVFLSDKGVFLPDTVKF